MASPNPTPHRQRVRTYPTPLIGDLLFYETVVVDRNDHPTYGTPHEDVARYPGHCLVFISPVEDAERTNLFRYFYAADRETQDLYNFEFTDADIGGMKFDAVQRSYVFPRKDFDPDLPAMGASMPDSPSSMFGTGAGSPSVISAYVLAERKQNFTQEKELNSLYVFEVRTYVKRTAIKEIGVDPLNGQTLYSTVSLYYATEVVPGQAGGGTLTAAQLFAAPTNAYWGLQSDGTQRSGKQLSADWYLIETAQVIGGTMVNGVLSVHSYTSNDNYYWPPVLDQYELLGWERLDGGFDYFPAIRFSPEGYNGPCLTTTTVTWSKAAFTGSSTPALAVVEQMQPTRVYYASPFFTLNIPECLHAKIGLKCDILATDPIYDENVASTRWFSATNFTTWPATIVAFDDQQPFRGGYLRTRKVVTRPVAPTQANWTTGVVPP